MRKVFFWLHLLAGVAAGIFILIMCVTGVALTYEKQINEWIDQRDLHWTRSQSAAPSPAEQLLARVAQQKPGGSGLTFYSDPARPAQVSFGREALLFVDPASGEVVGQRNPSALRNFLQASEQWHRWLAMTGTSRGIGKAIMDAANLLFFGLTLSGLYLWFPRKWTWQHIRPALWFRGGLTGKARDWNWHNAIGFWILIPMVAIVGSGVVMSYSWASDLLFTLSGSQQTAGGPGRGNDGRPGRPKEDGRGPGSGIRQPVSWEGLNRAVSQTQSQFPNWRSIRVEGSPNPRLPITVNVERENDVAPIYQASLTIDRATGDVQKLSDFSTQNLGQKLRGLVRFTHTGESLGFWGQTIAGIATAGGILMVYTGLALSFRRWQNWRRRRSSPQQTPEQSSEPRKVAELVA
ncbi:MAG: PepSY-associated TM helix domain-containing protein [Bryobacteraceae bacterium]